MQPFDRTVKIAATGSRQTENRYGISLSIWLEKMRKSNIESTVKFHVNNILSKLGVSDRTGAVIVALKRGIANL